MTAQISDSIHYAGDHYVLTEVCPETTSDRLFAPGEYGITTVRDCSACWRGYLAIYGLRENRLVLEDLAINILDPEWQVERQTTPALKESRLRIPSGQGESKPRSRSMRPGPFGPAIHGVPPVSQADTFPHPLFNEYYHRVGLPLPFTGRLFLGLGLAEGLYGNELFPSPWRFEKVFELTFAKGVLTATHDRSREMRKIRQSRARAYSKKYHRSVGPAKIIEWITHGFGGLS